MASSELLNEDIRSLRQTAKLSFAQVVEQSGIEPTSLRKFERGLDELPAEDIDRLAVVLSVTPSYIRKLHKNLKKNASTGEGYVTAIPDATFQQQRRNTPASGSIKVLDLFCGTGGFSHGFEMTGEFQVVGGIDLLPDRIETFVANHPAANALCADIRRISVDDLVPKDCQPDIVIGGPPCQGFSSLRPFRTLTEKDPRNHLFEQFAITVDAYRPQWFVMENVVGILTNQKGQILENVIHMFESIGYTVSWQIINCAFYGLPQRRERFVLVGNRDGKVFEWPEPTHYFAGAKSMAGRHGQHKQIMPLFNLELKPAVTVMDAIHDLPEIESGCCASHYRNDVTLTDYERLMRGASDVLTLHESTKHSEKMLEIIRHAGFNKAALPEGMVTSGFSTCYSRLEPDLPSVTLTVNFVHPASNKCIHPIQNRALTPREGARLQSFPDQFSFRGSRAQIIKQIGNAVPPLLGKTIAQALARQIR